MIGEENTTDFLPLVDPQPQMDDSDEFIKNIVNIGSVIFIEWVTNDF